MNKAVLISIHPKWCDLIANGRKTIEVRKTRPKLDTPFKCYIYCTQKKGFVSVLKNNERADGKVIGEFVCDEIYEWKWEPDACENAYDGDMAYNILTVVGEQTGLEYDELEEYGAGKTLYGWHISDLKIYDKQRELGEFECLQKTRFGYAPYKITRPPQSFCYVEELK